MDKKPQQNPNKSQYYKKSENMPHRNRKYPNCENLEELLKPHVQSFDHFIDIGIETMLENIKPVKITDKFTNTTLEIKFGTHELSAPQKGHAAIGQRLLPFECRQEKGSYSGKFIVEVCFSYNGRVPLKEKFKFGQLPIMLKSKLCHLRGANAERLVAYREEPTEMGGYFIVNGLERLIRFLIMPKRNYPMNVERDSFRERQDGYTNKAVIIRCVRNDQSSVTNKLYYLQSGSARLGFWVKGREFLLPIGLVLKALIDTNDHEIYASLTCCYSDIYQKGERSVGTQLVGERVKIILDEVQGLSLFTRAQCIQHIGKYFQSVMDGMDDETDSSVGETVLEEYILVHLQSGHDKYNLLIFMLQKLFAFIDHRATEDNTDALQNHEVLQPGHLITIYLKDKLHEWLFKARRLLQDELSKKGQKFEFGSLLDVKKVLDRNPSKSIGTAIESMLKTGRLASQNGLDLQQKGGMTVQAERLNFLRFISHFRSVHRGAAFAGNRNTSVRKLLPEAWGFLCPVHTPDGEPCGLLNHMASTCRITSYFDSKGNIKDFFKIRLSILSVLIGVGMTPSLPKLVRAGPPEVLSVLLDGCVIGSISSNMVEKAVAHIRKLKLSANSGIPDDLEVGYVPLSVGGAYPGLYLFSSPSRFVRPVISLNAEKNHDIELIGPFEQVYMEIRCADGGEEGRTDDNPATHEEMHPTGLLSVVANLTPYSDHNQSPRNMYQCQMAKQTVGFSSQALQFRADQKLYHLQTPQTPIVRTEAYTKYNIDEFPTGTNAIVAVLAYTGYDMEDAMILNKSSVERGMCHTSIYQLETIDLEEQSGKSDHVRQIFARSNIDKSVRSSVDSDGLPYVGQVLHPGQPYCSTNNTLSGAIKEHKLKGSEPVTVDYVAVDVKHNPPQKVNIRFRRPRNPIIGDKFSSRHGQKGVCSQLWPDIDMPFSGTTGMRPDLIINPHAFPSRMTIGMLLESIAAKGGCLNGKFVDATPFPSSSRKENKELPIESDSVDDEVEPESLLDELGPLLTSHGFNSLGSEVLYSGVLGTELVCEIFIGPVYYQRLRHMVSDKFQVRNTGAVDPTTRQPMKGRKRGGGIRFGEMERDSLLAHGAAYLLHDRLHTASDFHVADVCSLCGSILTTSFIEPQKKAGQAIAKVTPRGNQRKVTCHACKTSKGMEKVAMPFVFRYLAAELAAMNVKMTLNLSAGASEKP
ncbi:hypothetical protein IFM89_026715 [Coptis chinensis]|uniref:DNA-directed RNA polymerase subunit beta n=1 Tax=Coptis chinensis TaxID=261450 RepID=A0A835H9D3_9MAGN|nr:hypothetical protein IFM89_026715 [Coptis chinensis]